MAAPMPEPAYVRAADLVTLFYIYGVHSLLPQASIRTVNRAMKLGAPVQAGLCVL